MPDATTLTRRRFLQAAAVTASFATLPLDAFASVLPEAVARYHRYSVTSPEGQKALVSYAKGVEAMLNLAPDHPHNWFRNAFAHLMDCPHGNWWFYVWHRAYLGYFEQTVRKLSGDPDFAIPFWDWTTTPQIPDGMFNGVLNPSDAAFEPYIRNLEVFTGTFRPALANYLNTLSLAQVSQLKLRGYGTIDAIWDDVNGHDAKLLHQPDGHTNNVAHANPSGARYLTRANPKFDEKTTYNVSPFVIRSGLTPTQFYDPKGDDGFTSSKTTSHQTAPGSGTTFSILEGLPHNKVHNYIGGTGPLDPGPWGYMTNFLSPVDPIFFLHHANMDRLWDIWTRKQRAAGLSYLPADADLDVFSKERFLFFVDVDANYVTNGVAGDYLATERWDYDYGAGFGEDVIGESPVAVATGAPRAWRAPATIRFNTASAILPRDALTGDLGGVIAKITLGQENGGSEGREFDVLIGDGAGFAGTLSFFGHMRSGRDAPANGTFIVPIPRGLIPKGDQTLSLKTEQAVRPLNFRVVSSRDSSRTVSLRSASVFAR